MTGRLPRGLAALLLAVLVASCLDPLEDEADDGSAPAAPLGSEAMDPAGEALAEEVDRLVALLTEARDLLHQAAEAGDLASAQAAADRVEQRLVGDPGDSDVLFPVETLDRGSISERDDLLSRTLTAAREAGDDGRAVTESVRDLLAGDLGGWQRDAEGMVAWADEVAVARDSLDDTEREILELPGGGTQALAYVLLIERAGSLERAQAYAERGAAHLEVARSLLADLDLGDDTPDADPPGGDATGPVGTVGEGGASAHARRTP